MVAFNTPLGAAPEIKLQMFDPMAIQCDAATYQFRKNYDANGVTEKYRYKDTEWNPVLHGNPLLIHERLDGSCFVADGHHRLDFAKRLTAEGKGPKQIAAYVMREADGYTTQDVKVIAAYKNMAHGHSDILESARVFKESRLPQIHQQWLPKIQMDTSDLRMSYTLSGLGDAALDTVEQQQIPVEIAANVATRFTDANVQQGVLDIIAKHGKMVKGSFAERVELERQQSPSRYFN